MLIAKNNFYMRSEFTWQVGDQKCKFSRVSCRPLTYLCAQRRLDLNQEASRASACCMSRTY